MDTKHHSKLTAHERDLIATWKGGEISLREIARRLGKSHSTIIEEVKRNSFHDGRGKYYYVSIWAQSQTKKRARKARERHPLKNSEIYSYVLKKLRNGWSPEQIAGRLKNKYRETIICHETIYRFIYAKGNKEKNLWEKLPRKQKKRKKQKERKVHRSRIPDRVSIHLRPEEVNKRAVFGHWEGDSIEGKKINKSCLHTEAERLSRKIMAKKVNDLTSKQTIKVQKKMFSKLPAKARKSTTLDNGRENHCHYQLRKMGMKTYHCDPYSSWQRGTNEYHNGLIRRYCPKGTDFSKITQEEIDDIVWEINNRPRKCLNYNTPQEVFNLYLSGRIPS